MGAISSVKGQIDLLKSPISDTQAAAQGMGEAKTEAKTKGGTGLNILESRGVQNFNISIDKLVEMIKVETTQIKEGAGEIKEIVAQALIEAVNDFQLMATKWVWNFTYHNRLQKQTQERYQKGLDCQ